jgi:hypothetical protein
MGSITAALSTRFGACFESQRQRGLLFFIGLVAKYLVVSLLGAMASISILVSALLPNWPVLLDAGRLAIKRSIPLEYVCWAFIYAALYIALWASWPWPSSAIANWPLRLGNKRRKCLAACFALSLRGR